MPTRVPRPTPPFYPPTYALRGGVTYRRRAGLTQAQLAAAAEIADATLSRIERGRLVPSVDLAGRLAGALGVKIDELSGAVPKDPKGARLRPAVARLVAVVRDMADGEVDDVTKAVKLLVGVGRRSSRHR